MIVTTELLGYAAAALVLLTFSLRSLTALRAMAIASNLMFIAYALAAHLDPVLILHLALLPLNLWRLAELRAGAAARPPHAKNLHSHVWLAPVDPIDKGADVSRRSSTVPFDSASLPAFMTATPYKTGGALRLRGRVPSAPQRADQSSSAIFCAVSTPSVSTPSTSTRLPSNASGLTSRK